MDGLTSSLGLMLGLFLAWYILQAVADWKILSKAGRPGWLSFIPVVNVWAEYSICWSGLLGIVYCLLLSYVSAHNGQDASAAANSMYANLAGAAALVLHVVQSFKLARSFGKGFLFGIFLILFGPLARLILGLGDSRYVGKR